MRQVLGQAEGVPSPTLSRPPSHPPSLPPSPPTQGTTHHPRHTDDTHAHTRTERRASCFVCSAWTSRPIALCLPGDSYAYVEFAEKESVNTALAVNDTQFKSRELKALPPARPRKVVCWGGWTAIGMRKRAPSCASLGFRPWIGIHTARCVAPVASSTMKRMHVDIRA